MCLDFPRGVCFDPTHKRMLPHPSIQYLFARIGERVPTAASHAPKRDAEVRAKEASQRSSECRSLSIAKIVCPYTLPQRGTAWWSSIQRRGFGRDANIQQITIINLMTRRSIDTKWRFVEIPCIDTGARRDRARAAPNIQGCVQTIRIKKQFGVFIHVHESPLRTRLNRHRHMLRKMPPQS